MSGVNLAASAFDAVLPALVIPREGNGVYGIVTAFSGIAMVAGSFLPMILPKPKDRVRVIYLTMLFALGTENFLMIAVALGLKAVESLVDELVDLFKYNFFSWSALETPSMP